MGTTIQDLKRWFEEGIDQGAAYMIVMCDTFDHEDYPVYVMPNLDFWEEYKNRAESSMQRVMEVYDYKLSWQDQKAGHVHNEPPKPSAPNPLEYLQTQLKEIQVKIVTEKSKTIELKKDEPKIGQRKVQFDSK